MTRAILQRSFELLVIWDVIYPGVALRFPEIKFVGIERKQRSDVIGGIK